MGTKPGEGYNIMTITESLKEAGFDQIVSIATQTKNRNGDTRRALELVRMEMEAKHPECIGDLDVLTYWCLGWTNPLRDVLKERIEAKAARDKAAKPKPKEKRAKVPIDFSGGPVSGDDIYRGK
jgi:hypothetical protein